VLSLGSGKGFWEFLKVTHAMAISQGPERASGRAVGGTR